MLTAGARMRNNRWWALPMAVLILSVGLGGCLEDAEDQCFVFDNPNDTEASSVCAGGEPVDTGTGSSSVTIVHVATVNEIVVLANTGLVDQNVTGWTLANEVSALAADIFTFPTFTLLQGAFVRVHSVVGTDDADDLYWDGGDHWETLDSSILKDDAGNTIDTCGDNEVCWDAGD